jgi:subtilisin family serine protease
VGAGVAYNTTTNADLMAGFSSQGPTDVDFRIKPDVVAPGVNVLSSIPHQSCSTGDTTGCFAFFQGTSMATPHLAGSAAVVKSQHPDWSAAQIRSAIVNTADSGVLKTTNGAPFAQPDPNITGAGRENLLSAVQAVAALGPVSTSFGAVPSGSGQTNQKSFTITNISGSSKTYALSVGPATGSGVSFSLSATSVMLGAGESATITITASSAQGASVGDHYATLKVNVGSTEVAHAVVYQLVK